MSYWKSYRKNVLAVLLVGFVALVATGCGAQYQETKNFFKRMFSEDSFHLYRMNIVQGNVLNHKLIQSIRLGSSKEQVAFLLGNPILPSMFHEDRWDYVYYVDSVDKETQYYRLTLFFEKDQVVRLRRAERIPVSPKPERATS